MRYTRQLTAISSLGFAVLAGCGDGDTIPEVGESSSTELGTLSAGHGADLGNHGQAACGNGVVNPMEDCDDGNNADGDGCSAACEIEVGYACAGKKPSLCATVCDDGIVAGAEECDDGNGSTGDGCDGACHIEAGYVCSGAPSVCVTVCGDGIVAGAEACDDGNGSTGDGCDATCGVETGYGCSGSPSVCTTICGDGLIIGAEVCDDGNAGGGDGCDAACDIEAGSSCKGLPSVCTPGCGDGTVAGSEDCDDGNAGDGDGCNSICQIEPGFTCFGTKSLCCIPEVEPNNDAASANGPLPMDVFACGLVVNPDVDYFSVTLPVGGDLVVETYDKTGDNTKCTINTQIDLYSPDGTTLIGTNDDNGLLYMTNFAGLRSSLCSTMVTAAYPSPYTLAPGTYYVRVKKTGGYALKVHAITCGDGVIERSEQCEGGPSCNASCIATSPGLGESMATADPSPVCPLTLNSTVRLGTPSPPSCFPASGPIQWYSHVATDDILAVSANAPGPIALFDAAGHELRCSADASESSIATFSTAGQTYYAAVPVSTSATCLSFSDHPYDGVQGTLTDLHVTFSPANTATFYSMATSPTSIFLDGYSQLSPNGYRLFEVPKTGNTTTVLHGTSDGVSNSNMGEDITFANGSLFSLTVFPTVLVRHFDGTTWAPTAWGTLTIPGGGANWQKAVAFDGSDFISTTVGCTTQPFTYPVRFYSYSAAAPSQGQELASISPLLLYCANGIAADKKYLYVSGNGAQGLGLGPQQEGIYRFDRANLLAAPVQIASLKVTPAVGHVTLVLDDVADPHFLYARSLTGDIHVIADPAGSAEHVGVISTLGRSNGTDRGMAYDKVDQAIYFVEAETTPAGKVWKLQ